MVKPDWTKESTREVRDDEYPISPSATKRLKRCPEQFRLRYLTDKDQTKPAGKYADVGSAVHEAIENTIQNEDLGSLINRPNQLRQQITDEYRNRVPDQYDEDTIDSGVVACQTASRYLSTQEVTNFRGIEAEFEFALSRPDIDSAFKGIMDVATQNEIWDWKTGKTVKEEDEKIQGMLYAMGYYQEFGIVPNRVRFVYLHEEMQRERVFEPTDDSWQKALSHVRNVVQAKENEEFPAKPDSSTCYWCSLEGHCSASPVGAGDIRYEVF